MMKMQLDDNRIIYLSKNDERLKTVIHSIGPIEVREHLDGYKFLVHEIVEQLLSNKVAGKMILRLNDLCEDEITPEKMSAIPFEKLKSIGISTAKVQYINALTDVVKNEPDFFMKLSSMNDIEVINTLKTVRGIGNWTAKMYLLFVLQRDDVLPYEDGAFLQSYKWLYETDNVSKAAIIEKCRKWSPYSSIAARYMYRVLDKGYTRITYKNFLESTVQ